MVLIVDDVPGVVVAFGAGLRRLSVPFHGAGSLAEARAAFPQYRWSGFILDIELPDGTGVEFLEWLRSHPDHTHTPAIVITANILIDDALVAQIARCGASLRCGAFTSPQIDTICGDLLGRSTASLTEPPFSAD